MRPFLSALGMRVTRAFFFVFCCPCRFSRARPSQTRQPCPASPRPRAPRPRPARPLARSCAASQPVSGGREGEEMGVALAFCFNGARSVCARVSSRFFSHAPARLPPPASSQGRHRPHVVRPQLLHGRLARPEAVAGKYLSRVMWKGARRETHKKTAARPSDRARLVSLTARLFSRALPCRSRLSSCRSSTLAA